MKKNTQRTKQQNVALESRTRRLSLDELFEQITNEIENATTLMVFDKDRKQAVTDSIAKIKEIATDPFVDAHFTVRPRNLDLNAYLTFSTAASFVNLDKFTQALSVADMLLVMQKGGEIELIIGYLNVYKPLVLNSANEQEINEALQEFIKNNSTDDLSLCFAPVLTNKQA